MLLNFVPPSAGTLQCTSDTSQKPRGARPEAQASVPMVAADDFIQLQESVLEVTVPEGFVR